MNTGKNILNAFEVIYKTYCNLNIFFQELDEIALKNDFVSIIPNNPHFLRWRSDNEVDGWYTGSFIKLFQPKDAELLVENQVLRKAHIYGLEVNFDESKFDDSPEVNLIKYEYNDGIPNRSETPTISYHWVFYNPLKKGNDFEFEDLGNNKYISYTRENSVNRYCGIIKTTFFKIKLMDINENTIDNYFKELIKL